MKWFNFKQWYAKLKDLLIGEFVTIHVYLIHRDAINGGDDCTLVVISRQLQKTFDGYLTKSSISQLLDTMEEHYFDFPICHFFTPDKQGYIASVKAIEYFYSGFWHRVTLDEYGRIENMEGANSPSVVVYNHIKRNASQEKEPAITKSDVSIQNVYQ